MGALPDRNTLIGYLAHLHDDKAAMYGEGRLFDLLPGCYLVRAEGPQPEPRGNWFYGKSMAFEEARSFSAWIAGLGETRIRSMSALPRVWPDGTPKSVDFVRIYVVQQPCPAIGSFTAPQRESGTVMLRPQHSSSNPWKSAEYAGGYFQVAIPNALVRDRHGVELVRLATPAALPIKKP